MATLNPEIEKLELMQAALVLRAYVECSDEIQKGIRDLLDILNDPSTDEDDRYMTLLTIADALFPNPHDGQMGMDLERSEKEGASYSSEMRKAVEEMDREEESFAQNLRQLMTERDLTQERLAQKLGVSQPAISNMLNRQCRPQRRTVQKLAECLDVSAEQLWPGFRSDSVRK